MKIEILSTRKEAKKAQGLTVVIDIFRASNTILAMCNAGAKKIITTKTLTKARALKKQHRKHLLCGERNRIKPADFDYDNSPSQISKKEFRNKSIILTTSAGSQAIAAATNAKEIIIGSFRNAKAVVQYVKKKKLKHISLIAIGTNAKVKAIEDELCAQYIKALLEGKKTSFNKIKKRIEKSRNASVVRKKYNGADLRFCLQINKDKLVPRVRKEKELYRIKPAKLS